MNAKRVAKVISIPILMCVVIGAFQNCGELTATNDTNHAVSPSESNHVVKDFIEPNLNPTMNFYTSRSTLTGYDVLLTESEVLALVDSSYGYNNALGLHLNDTYFEVPASKMPALKANTRYRIGFWSRLLVHRVNTQYPKLMLRRSSTSGYLEINVTNANWHYQYLDFQTDADTSNIHIIFYMNVGAGNIVDLSQLRLEQLP